MQERILNLIENPTEEDEFDLVFASISKCMKRSLNEEQQENLMDEINVLVSKHIKIARSGRIGVIFRASSSTVTTTSAAATTVPVTAQIQTHSPSRPAAIAHTNLPPPLQPIAQMHVDPYGNNNNTSNWYFE